MLFRQLLISMGEKFGLEYRTLNDVFETFREIQDLVEIELNIDECVSVKV